MNATSHERSGSLRGRSVYATNNPDPIQSSTGDIIQSQYDISHATLQVEPEDQRGRTELNWQSRPLSQHMSGK